MQQTTLPVFSLCIRGARWGTECRTSLCEMNRFCRNSAVVPTLCACFSFIHWWCPNKFVDTCKIRQKLRLFPKKGGFVLYCINLAPGSSHNPVRRKNSLLTKGCSFLCQETLVLICHSSGITATFVKPSLWRWTCVPLNNVVLSWLCLAVRIWDVDLMPWGAVAPQVMLLFFEPMSDYFFPLS